MCIVSWGWDRNAPGAANIGVAQLVGELLQLVSVEMVIIPEHVVVTRAGGSLDTCTQLFVDIVGIMKSFNANLGESKGKSRTQ